MSEHYRPYEYMSPDLKEANDGRDMMSLIYAAALANKKEAQKMSIPLVTYEKWLDYEEAYDDGSPVYEYDPDWYPPYFAPASQHMWADYVAWASTNFESLMEKSPFPYYNERNLAPYPIYKPYHPEWDSKRY